jgi:hypothetical protein
MALSGASVTPRHVQSSMVHLFNFSSFVDIKNIFLRSGT